MFSPKLNDFVENAVKAELENAKKQGVFANIYHAYAILKEEIEEAKENMNVVETRLEFLWELVRKNKDYNTTIWLCLSDINASAEEAVKELIQVLAVLQKNQRGGKMKDFGATIVIKFPVTFKADNMANARSRVKEVGKSMLAEKISSSNLVEISANNLQEILILKDKEE